MYRKIISALIFAVFVTSCGTTKLSRNDLDEFESGKKAIVTTYNQPLLASLILGDEPVTAIIAIDGEKLESAVFRLDEQVTVDTGTHEIEFSCVNRSGYDERDYRETITLDLKPHHKYLVRCSFDSDFGPDGTYTGSFSVEEERAG